MKNIEKSESGKVGKSAIREDISFFRTSGLSVFRTLPEHLYVFFGFFIFFLLTLASNFSGPHDSIGYLNGIVKGNALFHQHHLLYHFITHYWLMAVRPVFSGIPDYYLVEAFTALWGSGSLAIAYCFFRKRFGLPALLSWLCTAVIALTYGMWFYSVNIEVYAPPMFFLLAALYKLTDRNFSQRDVWKVALLQCAAILFHQVHILFSVTILYVLWKNRSKIKLSTAIVQYAAIGIVLVGGAYFIVGWIVEGENTMAKWVQWLQGYAKGDAYWESISARTPVNVATGLSHAFIGGHFIFRLPGISSYLQSAAGEHSLGDELFLVRNMSEGMAVFLTVLSVALALMMLWLTIRFFRKYKTIHKSWGIEISPLMVTAIVYSIFFCFWEPEILEFWIFQTVLFWLILLGTLAHQREHFPFSLKPVTGVAFMGICLFAVNFFGSLRYLLNLENDLYYVKTAPVKTVITPNDGVLLQDAWILKDFLEYYTPAEVREIPRADSQRAIVDNHIAHHLQKGAKLYIYPEGRPGKTDTHYIDSVLAANPGRHRIFHAANPKIIVIE